MSDHDKQLQFLHEIESDVIAGSRPLYGEEGEFREVAFTSLLADEMEAAGILESPVVCRLETGRGASAAKCNGYSIPDEDTRLDLFITLYDHGPHSELPTLNAGEVDVAFNKLERFLNKALTLDGLHNELDVAMPEWHMATRIKELAGDFDRVNFYVLTNKKLAVRRVKLRKNTVQNIPAFFEVWDIERFRRLRESGGTYEAVDVDLRSQPHGGLSCVLLEQDEKDWKTCVTIFPGATLANLYDEHGSRLLELNVRSYLQAKTKVNRNILETLKSNPEDVMAYNNGITIVAEELEFGYLDHGPYGIVGLKGMQIVNGGQTTASIHRAGKESGADLDKVFVQAKIVVVPKERFNEVVPMISRFANSQNKVTEPDLTSNHPFHVGIERIAHREWTPDMSSHWFYERSRGSYQTARTRDGRTAPKLANFDKKYPKSQCFDKEDLSRFECCWLGHAAAVNKGRQKCFTFFMTLIEEKMPKLADGWEPSPDAYKAFVAKAILYKSIQSIVKKDTAITAYRINVANFVAALLAEKSARRIDLMDIWRKQAISPALESTANAWAPAIFGALVPFAQRQGVHIDNALKSQSLWDHIKSLPLELGPAVETELLSAATAAQLISPVASAALAKGESGKKLRRQDKLTNEDQNNISRCLELDNAGYARLIDWAKKVGAEEKKVAIAGTLAGSALLGWPQPPTKAQAWHVAQLIRDARDAGAL